MDLIVGVAAIDDQITLAEQTTKLSDVILGDVTGDLAARRGRINGTTTLSGGMAMVSGQVPLSELGDYQSYLKSVTGGAGSYSMHLSHHDPVPGNIQQQLVEAYKPRSEDD